MPAERTERTPYHHGNLRAALIAGARQTLAETGVSGFSVARVARLAGVSSAAPYRHFPDREALLAAAVQEAATELTTLLDDAVAAAGPDPVDRLAAVAGAYTRFVLSRGAGLDVLYLDDLRDERFAELHERTRALMDRLLALAEGALITADGEPAREQTMQLLSQVMAAAHGYAVLVARGLAAGPPLTPDEAAARSAEAVRTLSAGTRARG